MFWGVSKNVGGGFRLGVGGRLGGKSSRSTRPSASEQRTQEKDQFIRETLSRFNDAVAIYFLKQGHLVMAQDIAKADQVMAAPLIPAMERFSATSRLVADGSNLTEKRKETILNAIYELEEIGDSIDAEHPIAPLYKEYFEAYGQQGACIIIAVVTGLIGLIWPFWFAGTVGSIAYYAYTASNATNLKNQISEQAIAVVTPLPN